MLKQGSSSPYPSKPFPLPLPSTSFGCLVFSPFLSKCVRPGKLPSLFVPQFRWQIDFDSVNTDRLSDTDTTPDSTGVAPLPSQLPSSLSYSPSKSSNPNTCLHAPLLQWKKAALIPPFCPLFLPCVLSPGGHSAGGVWWVGGDSDRESQRALHLLASHLYRH